MRHSKLTRFAAIASTALLVTSLTSTLHISLPTDTSPQVQVSIGSEVQARRSGGRSGGGSFRRSTPSRPSTPSRQDNSPNRRYDGGGPVIVPVPIGGAPYSGYGGSYSSSGGSWVLGLILLIIMLAIVIAIIYAIVKVIRSIINASKGAGEIDNDKVTVSKIQVALLSQARQVQSELTQLSLELETDREWGLLQLLQESALALLRTPENWSHVLASSQTVKSREEAEQVFNRLSIEERQKFSVETLSNMGGRVRQQDYTPDPDKDPASYIVVTLLVGTAHDKPLFDEIRTTEALQEMLEKLAAVPSEYLMKFELIWTPQSETDSLTYDELLMEYPQMYQI